MWYFVGFVEDPRDFAGDGFAVIDRGALAALALQHEAEDRESARPGRLDGQQSATLLRGSGANLFGRHFTQFHRTKKRAPARSVDTKTPVFYQNGQAGATHMGC